MLRNYFTVSVRNFLRNKTFSFIHILGLSIGISAALIIYQMVRFENSFDKFEKDSERIFRVVVDMKFNGNEGHGASVPAPLAMAMQNEVTGLEATAPVMQFQGDATAKVSVIANGADKPRVFKSQPDIIFTNKSYFEILPFEWKSGSAEKSLSEPFSVVMTESRARQYFPGLAPSEVIGKRINYKDELDVYVTGIVGDLNEHSDFGAVEFISYSTIAKTNLQKNFMMEKWNDSMAYSKLYVKLRDGKQPSEIQYQIKQLIQKYSPGMITGDFKWSFRLQPLGDIHFNTVYADFGQRTAQKSVLYGLLAIAGFLIVLACINFMNLSTAQATRRMKEICIRKSIGGSRKQLIVQFLGETLIVTVIATLISISLIPLLLDFFSDFIPPGLTVELFSDSLFYIFLLGLIIIVSFFSGLYPALIISRYQPAAGLKGQVVHGSETRSSGVRKALTISQFVIAQFFVIAAFIVTKQIHFSLNQSMGFRKEAILNFEMPRDERADLNRKILLDKVASVPGIQLVSTGFLPPATAGYSFSNILYNDGKKEIKGDVQIRWGDENYLKLYGIPLVAGRNIRAGEGVEEVLINENYLHELGMQNPQDALDKELTFYGGKKIPIVGVMRDFHLSSFHAPIGSIVFQSSTTGNFFHLALEPQNSSGTSWHETIQSVQKTYQELFPEADFNYSFYDQTIEQLYEDDQKTSKLLNWSMGLTVLISCLGLLGLVIYTSVTRTKEIGIRKILGATVSNIVLILSFEFVQLVLIAFVIAAPVAAWVMNNWLEKFAYRTTMSWWIFASAGGFLVLAAILTLSIQTVRTAVENPVKSLRNE
jgi:putative ABC transport system permease protein